MWAHIPTIPASNLSVITRHKFSCKHQQALSVSSSITPLLLFYSRRNVDVMSSHPGAPSKTPNKKSPANRRLKLCSFRLLQRFDAPRDGQIEISGGRWKGSFRQCLRKDSGRNTQREVFVYLFFSSNFLVPSFPLFDYSWTPLKKIIGVLFANSYREIIRERYDQRFDFAKARDVPVRVYIEDIVESNQLLH